MRVVIPQLVGWKPAFATQRAVTPRLGVRTRLVVLALLAAIACSSESGKSDGSEPGGSAAYGGTGGAPEPPPSILEIVLGCYCGSLAGQECTSTGPSVLDGQCVDEILAGTGCTTSACVAPVFLNASSATGKAMQYAQCRQDFCYEVCFNP